LLRRKDFQGDIAMLDDVELIGWFALAEDQLTGRKVLQRGMFCDLLNVDIINMLKKRVFFENGD
jgi:hypothetical protein